METIHIADLIKDNREMMLSYARTLLRNHPEEVNDLVDNAAFTAAQEFHQYHSEDVQFPTWIRSVIRYEASRRLQRKGIRSYIDNDSVAYGIEKVYENLDSLPMGNWSDRLRIIWRCVMELPKNTKEILKLQYITGQDIKEIGKKVTKHPANVAKALARARIDLSARLSEKVKGYL